MRPAPFWVLEMLKTVGNKIIRTQTPSLKSRYIKCYQ